MAQGAAKLPEVKFDGVKKYVVNICMRDARFLTVLQPLEPNGWKVSYLKVLINFG